MEQLKKETREMIKVYRELYNRMEDIADAYISISSGKSPDAIESIEINGDHFEVSGYNHAGCSCCSDDYFGYDIPISTLWDPTWDEKLRQELLEKNLAAIKAREEKEKKAKEEKERKEYEQYLKLKEKYDV